MSKSITKWDIHTDYKVDETTNFYVDLENLGKFVNEHSAGVLNTHKSMVLVDQPRVKLSVAKAF